MSTKHGKDHNCPYTDILCSNLRVDRFVHIQVKTFRPGNATCSVGTKAESNYGDRFFWVLAGVPEPGTAQEFVYYVIPSPILAPHILADNEIWKTTLGRKGAGAQSGEPVSCGDASTENGPHGLEHRRVQGWLAVDHGQTDLTYQG